MRENAGYRIDYAGFMNLLCMIGFKPQESMIKGYKDAFNTKDGSGQLNFNQFLDLFKLKLPKEGKV